MERKKIQAPLHTGANHGVYSSKQKVPKGQDLWGKPLSFNCTAAPFYEPKQSDDRGKGKQIVTRWPHTGEFFSKLSYNPEAYEDASKKVQIRKFGFATGRPLNRDDLSSTIEVGRFRHQLETEQRMDKGREQALQKEAEKLRNRTAALRSSGGLQPKDGLASMLPHFTSGYDRERFVPEFDTRKLPAGRKYERRYGAVRSTAADIGEGCDDKSILKAPEHGVGDFANTFASRYAHPTVQGKMTFAH